MLADPRAKAKVREFLMAWLKLDQPRDLTKDEKRFPDFDAAVASDLRTSLELFLDDVMWSPNADYRQLFLSEETYLNGRLARYYGVEMAEKASFQKIRFEPERRAGILTHPYVLTSLAYRAESSPIHRGVFLGRGILGIAIRPPNDAFTPIAPDLHPSLTTRERVSLQTKPAACSSCHGIMNPLGFALENFDAVGAYRDKERGKPIDPSGRYEARSGTMVNFTGAKELANFLASSEETQYAFAQQTFHHFVKQPVRAYGLSKPEELRKSFAESGFHMRKLLIEIAAIGALPLPAEPPPRK
jgi:hypothetical protein